MVKEPRTGVEFQQKRSDGKTLLGMAVRSKFGFKVYAVAFYADLSERFSRERGGKPERWLISSEVPRVLVIHFVRNVPGKKMQETFRENMRENMTEKDLEGSREELERFFATMANGARKGERVEFERLDKRVRISAGGKVIYETSDPAVMNAFFAVYFGPKSVAPDLPRGVKKGLEGL